VKALVVVTEFLSAKGKGAARDAVGFEEVAVGEGTTPPKSGYSLFAFRYSPRLKRQLMQAARYAGSKGRTKCDWGSSSPRLRAWQNREGKSKGYLRKVRVDSRNGKVVSFKNKIDHDWIRMNTDKRSGS
jgi:hypothetical protein